MDKILIVGNPVDGITVYGPYPYVSVALLEAERFSDTDWWITNLHEPETDDPEGDTA